VRDWKELNSKVAESVRKRKNSSLEMLILLKDDILIFLNKVVKMITRLESATDYPQFQIQCWSKPASKT